MVKLEKCPCCGAAAAMREVHVYLATGWRAQCLGCGLQTQYVLVNTPVYKGGNDPVLYTADEARQMAADVWNRRPRR